MRVSVIIPTLNRRDLLRECLESIPGGMCGVAPYEVIVVDSGTDGAAEEAERFGVRTVKLEELTHFARAVNKGAQIATGEWLLLLNDDAALADGAGAAMLGTASALAASIVGSRTLLPDGRIQQAGVAFRSGDGRPAMLDYTCAPGAEPRPDDRRVASVCFACALVRRDVFEALGRLDEAYVNAYEDVDFCLRAIERGYGVAYHGSGRTVHHWAISQQDRQPSIAEAWVRLSARWSYRLKELVARAEDSMIQAPPGGGYKVERSPVPQRAWASESVRRMEAEKDGGDRTRCTLDAVQTPADLFHVLHAHCGYSAWMGVQIVKNHFDMARYAGLIARLRPACVVETGAQLGGSTIFFMHMLATMRLDSLVVSVDSRGSWDRRVLEFGHPIALLRLDCLAQEAIEAVKTLVGEARSQSGRERIIVSLDSVHTEEHVTRELELYAPLCRPGDYLVVEDTDHSGHPIMSDYGPSAWHAVRRFLASDAPFVADDEIERAYGPITASPSGWLRRV